MYEEKVTLKNDIGLHARAASAFIQEAVKFESEITVVKDGQRYNGKSIMSILSMSARKGQELSIQAEGEDSVLAVQSLSDLIENKLDDY